VVQLEAPVAGWDVPAAQLVHELAATTEYVPAAQMRQVADVDAARVFE
jgi:hypothetical protein